MPPVIRPTLPSSIKVSGDQSGGVIKGTATPGATVEAQNLSSPEKAGFFTSLFRGDAYKVGKADRSGAFSGSVAKLQEGDYVRLRDKGTGATGNWLTVRVTGMGKDTRNAPLDMENVTLRDLGQRKVEIGQTDGAKPLSEPHAYIEVRNTRSGDSALLQCDEHGNIPAGETVTGLPGDTFTFHVSDGVNNNKLAEEAGRIKLPGEPPQVDLPEPALHAKYVNSSGTTPAGVKRYTGPLFLDGPSATDVKQGYLGDCYLCASAAALAQRAPEALQKAMVDNGDGTVTVTFKKYDATRRAWKEDKVTVDRDLYSTSRGPLYGKGTNATSTESMETWFPILEKAYAQWKGSYDKMGSGGHASDVFSAVLGRPASSFNVKSAVDGGWGSIKKAVDKKDPVVATTYGETEKALYTNTGVHPNHAYTVMGYEVDGAGQKYVQLRNPWAHDEPSGDGVDDGIFKMKLEDFRKLYNAVHVMS